MLNQKFLFQVSLVFCLLSGVLVNDISASWRDKSQNKYKDFKTKAKEKISSCRERSRDFRNKTKERYQRYRSKYNTYKSSIGEKIKNIRAEYGENIARKIQSMRAKYGNKIGDKLRTTLEHCAGQVGNYVRNPEKQKKIFNAIIISSAVYCKFKEKRKSTAYNLVNSAMNNIKVKDRHGNVVSLNQFSKDWIVEKAPYLKGTDIAEEPVKALTYGLVYRDTDYITQEMKIVRSKGKYVSIKEAVNAKLGIRDAVKYFSVAKAFNTVSNPDSSLGDMAGAVNTINNFSMSQ